MFYGNIKQNDISNGEGVRTSLFVSGCRLGCKDCFNRDTWSFKYGSEFTAQVEERILNSLVPGHIAGLTILGGEPLEEENQAELLPFLKKVKARYPKKNIWLFTGYTFEDDLLFGGKKHTAHTYDLLDLVDVMVDGPFISELKQVGLKFRGSSNQRILEMQASLRAGKAVLKDTRNRRRHTHSAHEKSRAIQMNRAALK